MSCCGSKRQNWNASSAHAQPEAYSTTQTSYVRFRYTGRHGLTVMGGVTGRAYHFSMPGAEVLIDRRDALGMYAVPHVELVRTSG